MKNSLLSRGRVRHTGKTGLYSTNGICFNPQRAKNCSARSPNHKHLGSYPSRPISISKNAERVDMMNSCYPPKIFPLQAKTKTTTGLHTLKRQLPLLNKTSGLISGGERMNSNSPFHANPNNKLFESDFSRRSSTRSLLSGSSNLPKLLVLQKKADFGPTHVRTTRLFLLPRTSSESAHHLKAYFANQEKPPPSQISNFLKRILKSEAGEGNSAPPTHVYFKKSTEDTKNEQQDEDVDPTDGNELTVKDYWYKRYTNHNHTLFSITFVNVAIALMWWGALILDFSDLFVENEDQQKNDQEKQPNFFDNPTTRSFWMKQYFIYSPGDLETERWYTVLTSTYSHFSPEHLTGNMFALWTLGPQLHKFIGRTLFMTLYTLAGIVGNIFSEVFMYRFSSYELFWKNDEIIPYLRIIRSDNENSGTLGASGSLMGLAATFLFLFPRKKIYISRGAFYATRFLRMIGKKEGRTYNWAKKLRFPAWLVLPILLFSDWYALFSNHKNPSANSLEAGKRSQDSEKKKTEIKEEEEEEQSLAVNHFAHIGGALTGIMFHLLVTRRLKKNHLASIAQKSIKQNQ